ncbi:MAG: hypothetical protein HYV63_01695 [Candidatus Schekmanbacteria bacterium]|nr:hypothetical protein [Candidatus Schekmanbacteria bacterium]
MQHLSRLAVDESGQTTVEWIVLSIMIGVTMVTIALVFADALIEIFEKIKEKINDFADAIGF